MKHTKRGKIQTIEEDQGCIKILIQAYISRDLEGKDSNRDRSNSKERIVCYFLRGVKDTKPQIQDIMNNKQNIHSKTAKTNENYKRLKAARKKDSLSKNVQQSEYQWTLTERIKTEEREISSKNQKNSKLVV